MRISLKTYRKQTQLTQSDMAFLLCRKQNGGICHAEGKHKTPSLQVLLLYHIVFDTPLEQLVQPHKETIHSLLKERLPLRIGSLKESKPTERKQSRIAFLEKTLTRLTPSA